MKTLCPNTCTFNVLYTGISRRKNFNAFGVFTFKAPFRNTVNNFVQLLSYFFPEREMPIQNWKSRVQRPFFHNPERTIKQRVTKNYPDNHQSTFIHSFIYFLVGWMIVSMIGQGKKTKCLNVVPNVSVCLSVCLVCRINASYRQQEFDMIINIYKPGWENHQCVAWRF